MISDKEIEEAAEKEKYYFNIFHRFNREEYAQSFINGANWAQKKIMDNAASGFAVYAESRADYWESLPYGGREDALDSWQAAKISSMKEIGVLRQRLAEAEKVIGFYADVNSWSDKHHDDHDDVSIIEEDWGKGIKTESYFCGGKRAREYQKKHGVNK